MLLFILVLCYNYSQEMRRVSYIFVVVALCTANVFAASSSISRAIPTKNTSENVEQKSENVSVKNRSGSNISRTVSRSKNVNVASRNVKKQNANVVSRSLSTRSKGTSGGLDAAVNTVGRNARTEAASINNTAAVRRAGITLRASTAEVGGRATIGNTGIQTGSNIDEEVRNTHGRSALFGTSKQKTVTAESLAAAKEVLEKTNDLNSVCQQQYNECMDQFCAVVDANQKRCSCSANLARYEKAQEAVEKANTELNEVAQRIRYVGLSADEIRAIMSATEAELEMGKTKDNTKTRSMLDDIADMIKDPTGSITLVASNDSTLDMDFDFSSDSSDMFSLDLFNSNSTDISAKRGTALYKEAVKRCKSVINQCKDAGGTESQITGNYDLAIAKDCVAYEQGLEKLNTTLLNNVRSANLMLQKARLAVLQNKNEYDAKECIGALEKCMLDDMVCGDDYVKCLDPTKRYIDENGEVVLGKNIANITNFMTDYNNTKIAADFIKSSASDTTCPDHDGACIVNYLMQKIGTGATVKEGGLCRAVLDKCQYYTYDNTTKTPTYKPYNEVVVGYIQRAMVNIKAAQARIISEYASTCMNDVQDCYNQQNTQITSWSSSANVDNIYKVMTGACYNVALTCGYAVFAYDKEMGTITEDTTLSEKDRQLKLIDGISQMFYQSMLCPENSEYVSDTDSVGLAKVNDRCVCKEGYNVSGNSCVSACPSGTVAVNRICQTWIAPTTSCSKSYVEAVFYNGEWRPKNCNCDNNRYFSMSYLHPATGYVGLCATDSKYSTNEYCSGSETGSTVMSSARVPSVFNTKTKTCDCPSGSILLEERCRSISDVHAKSVVACYAINCAHNPYPTELNPDIKYCTSNGTSTGTKLTDSYGWACGYGRFANGFQDNCKYNESRHTVDCN